MLLPARPLGPCEPTEKRDNSGYFVLAGCLRGGGKEKKTPNRSTGLRG